MNKLSVAGQLLRPYFPHLIAVVAAAALGLGVGLVKMSTLPPEVDANDNWPLPQWAPYQPTVSSRDLASLELWGEDDSEGDFVEEPEPRDASAWEIVGIVHDGQTRVAIIEYGVDRKLQRLTVGDSLPDGAIIQEIGANDLTALGDNTETVIRLFEADEI